MILEHIVLLRTQDATHKTSTSTHMQPKAPPLGAIGPLIARAQETEARGTRVHSENKLK